MAYTDQKTPVIESVILPSGNSYYIADRQLRNVVDDLRDAIAAGVSFNIAWDGTAAPVVAQIPAGVVVTYNGTEYTGSLDAAAANPGTFYLVKSATTAGAPLDSYDQYVVVKPDSSDSTTWYWEKIGDTQVDLSDVVTNVTLNKQTDTVIGTDSTFTVTQPTVTLSTGTSGDITIATGGTTKHMTASASGGNVTASKTNIKATASGGGAAWNSKDAKTVLTGVKVTADPTVSLASGTSGDVTVATGIGSATVRYLSASAGTPTVSANTNDTVTAITGLGTPTTQSAVKSVSPTTAKLATTTVTGVSGSTSPSVIQGRTSQTTATGAGTSSSTNTDWLKGVSVSNGVLSFGAATLNTQTTYSANAPGTITVPTAAASATTVATGSTSTTGSGASVVTAVSVGDTFNAVTGYTPSTDTVLGADTSFGATAPSVTLTANSTTATGRIQYVQAQGSATTTKLSATASGTGVGADGTASVIGSSSTFTNTQPTVTLATGATAGTGVISVATDIGTVTQPTITLADTATSGGVQFVSGVSTTKAKAAATNGNVAWNSKDSVTVLKSNTDVNVTKGS